MVQMQQVDSIKSLSEDYDFFIAASGFESRASYQAESFRGTAVNKICLKFGEASDNECRILNDKKFDDAGFQSVNLQGEDDASPAVRNLVEEIIQFGILNKKVPKVYFDYSSMTKNWYGYFLFLCKNLAQDISVTLGYSYGNYMGTKPESLNRIVKPLIGYCNLSVPSKPTALIIGVGDEPVRVNGLIEFFDATPYLFCTDHSYNSAFSKHVETLNKDLLEKTDPKNIFRFPMLDLSYTNLILRNLCDVLVQKFRVVIAPCGPKPFTLLALLNALQNPMFIDVWRISSGDKIAPTDVKANGTISAIHVVFDSVNVEK